MASIAERFAAKTAPPNEDGCVLWTAAVGSGGYGQLNIDGRIEHAHRVAWTLAYGAIPDGLHVRHYVCDNPPCVEPTHLKLGTHADNMRDMSEKGRARGGSGPGELAHNAKLREADVLRIRVLLAEGWTQTAIAKVYGVLRPTIDRIHLRKTCRISRRQPWAKKRSLIS